MASGQLQNQSTTHPEPPPAGAWRRASCVDWTRARDPSAMPPRARVAPHSHTAPELSPDDSRTRPKGLTLASPYLCRVRPDGSIEITLSSGHSFLIDPADAGAVLEHRWHTSQSSGKQYVRRRLKGGGCEQLHRFLAQPDADGVVDHINGDTLDNRRENLRLATPRQNSINTRGRQVGSSGFRGVRAPRKPGYGFAAEIKVDGKSMSLGTFSTAEEAAQAYDAAATEHFGSFAVLNFPGERS